MNANNPQYPPTDPRHWCRVCRPGPDPFEAMLGLCYEHTPDEETKALRAAVSDWFDLFAMPHGGHAWKHYSAVVNAIAAHKGGRVAPAADCPDCEGTHWRLTGGVDGDDVWDEPCVHIIYPEPEWKQATQ